MSGLEIERKFLVKKGDAYKSAAFSSSHIQQGYIPAEGATVRVRTRDEKAYLTIKGKSVNGGMTRYEFEKEITMDEAQHLLQLCQGGVIDKRRYLVKSGSHTFEVDEFYGDNEGLVMAEVELASETEAYEKPDFIGMEVTGDKRFYNSHLLGNPLYPIASGWYPEIRQSSHYGCLFRFSQTQKKSLRLLPVDGAEHWCLKGESDCFHDLVDVPLHQY